jgi:hypothetical protein
MPALLLRSHGYRPCRTKNEEEVVLLMRHENGTPANRRRRLHAALYGPYTQASTMLVVVLVVLVGLLAAIVMGPGRVIDWLANYLIPVGVIIASLALLVWAFERLPESPLRDWWQWVATRTALCRQRTSENLKAKFGA